MMKIERHQPDSHELNDWALYGSKDPEIAWLVDRLALDRGLRVREIKALTLQVTCPGLFPPVATRVCPMERPLKSGPQTRTARSVAMAAGGLVPISGRIDRRGDLSAPLSPTAPRR